MVVAATMAQLSAIGLVAQPCENPYLTVLPWLKPWLTLRMAPPLGSPG
jgi:hypothetical protein